MERRYCEAREAFPGGCWNDAPTSSLTGSTPSRPSPPSRDSHVSKHPATPSRGLPGSTIHWRAPSRKTGICELGIG